MRCGYSNAATLEFCTGLLLILFLLQECTEITKSKLIVNISSHSAIHSDDVLLHWRYINCNENYNYHDTVPLDCKTLQFAAITIHEHYITLLLTLPFHYIYMISNPVPTNAPFRTTAIPNCLIYSERTHSESFKLPLNRFKDKAVQLEHKS